MLNLPDVTLVAVSSVNLHATVRAMKISCKNINYNKVVLLSHKRPSFTSFKYTWIKIPRIKSIDEYSEFILYYLHKFIETNFALIVQYDGFVENYESWSSEFLQYDYIGAPWPISTDGVTYLDPKNRSVRVGNGGFSLRSKKILSLPSALGLEFKSYHGYKNEDGLLCCLWRENMRLNGVKYAPLNVAIKFSKESEIQDAEKVEAFGFHGKYRLKTKHLYTFLMSRWMS